MKEEIRQRMENAIKEIIGKIHKGKIFDSHYVINQLISDHSDVYLLFASELISSQKTTKKLDITAYVHSQISKKIGTLDLSDLVTRVKLDVKKTEFRSINVRGNATDCAGWKRK
ncbi:MAG: hypothetical protein LBQ87_10090 [Candidatus Fibromonas sp.]|nr:hypothetical protein [Candidatus Fibromonas sp.]